MRDSESDTQLRQLIFDLREYRTILERAFSRKLSRPRDCRRYFLELLIIASKLYLDYLRILHDMRSLERKAIKMQDDTRIDTDIQRERLLRTRLRSRLESLPCWSQFRPANSFSETTGLRTLSDYIDSLAHHLPEVHEETFQTEAYAREFRNSRSSAALAGLSVGLEHLGRNHISFVHFALEWAADESSWKE
ncbi:MAG: hypothetical protein ACRD22_06760 [Terriglobia bacterium]